MNHKTDLLLVLLIILLISGSCVLDKSRPVTISASDAGKTVDLKIGDKLDLTLEGNPSTGYGWEAIPADTAAADTAVVEQTGEAEFIPANGKLGSPGMVTLHFEAVAAGEQELRLVYHRPWETGVEPLQTFQVTVNVK